MSSPRLKPILLAGGQVYRFSSPPGITPAAPAVTGNRVRLNFTVISSLTNTTLRLIQTGELEAAWTTNTTATLVTNVPGISCSFTDTNNAAARFYQVQLGP